MNALHLVVFDCDGTLVDSQHRIGSAMALAFDRAGLEPPAVEETRRIVGLSLEHAIARLAPDLDEAAIDALSIGYREAFFQIRQNGEAPEPLYDGARMALDLLQQREDVVLGMATGKSRRGLEAILESHGLQNHFITLQTSDDAPSKPHPAMLHQAMHATGTDAAATVFVGDTSFDMEMARAAGVTGIGVNWGYHDRSELAEAGAACLIDHFNELPPLVDYLIQRGRA